MWQPSHEDCSTALLGGLRDTETTLDYQMRHALRELSLDKLQPVSVSSVPLSQLWTESFDPSQWTIDLFWSAGESSAGDVPTALVIISGHLPAPPLPPPGQGLVIVPPQQPLIPEQPGSDHFSVDDHSVVTTPHSANEHFFQRMMRRSLPPQGDPPDSHHQ